MRLRFGVKNEAPGTHALLSTAIGALCVCGIGYVAFSFEKHSSGDDDKGGGASGAVKKRRFGSPDRSGPSQERAPVGSARITRLFVFPVKSCRGYECSFAEVLPRGLRYDREWVVIRRRDNKVMTIRDIPAMRRVWAEIVTGAGESTELVLSYRPLNESANEKASSIGPLSVRVLVVPAGGKSVRQEDNKGIADIDIWGMAGSVLDEGKAASDFLTAVLNEVAVGSAPHETYYLGRMVQPRNPKLSGGSSVGLVLDNELRIRAQDYSSLHIVTEESMLWLKKELLAEHDGLPLPTAGSLAQLTDPDLYKPNIVVEGVPFPEEERWDTMTIKKKEVSKPAEESENVVAGSDNTSEPTANVKSEDASLNRRLLKGQHVYLKTAKVCDRCAVPSTGLDGVRDKGFQPTRFLREHHAIGGAPGKPNQGLLGLNVNVRLRSDDGVSSPATSSIMPTIDERDDETVLGVIEVGDELLVTAFKDEPAYL